MPISYVDIRLVHIFSAGISISLFLLRGALQFSGVDWRRWRLLRVMPHINDTILLAAAIALSLYSHQYPFAQGWLTAKLLALLLYIGLGSMALSAGRPRAQQAMAFGAALLTVVYIVAVAISRSATLGLA